MRVRRNVRLALSRLVAVRRREAQLVHRASLCGGSYLRNSCNYFGYPLVIVRPLDYDVPTVHDRERESIMSDYNTPDDAELNEIEFFDDEPSEGLLEDIYGGEWEGWQGQFDN